MGIGEIFSDFIANLAIQNEEDISYRYGELTSALNKRFRDTESKTANTLQVGSIGRCTGINGISDLDMLYIMPSSSWDNYKDGKQLKLLQDIKDAILERYPRTDVRVDRLVVTVTYTDFYIEVQPVFEQGDRSFLYPDTKDDGKWKTTKPRAEIEAISDADKRKNSNLRRLCKMVRSWKNKHGVGIGGLLIDTLCYNFLEETTDYDSKSFLYYDRLSKDFFKYISELPEQEYHLALGSGQRVWVKDKFQNKAKKAYKLCLEAIESESQVGVNEKWKKVYGRPFPTTTEKVATESLSTATRNWTDTEQFIEDVFPVDIRESLSIDCEVKQNGFRENFLKVMLAKNIPLLANKKLRFWVKAISVIPPYEIFWKVLNRGDVARRRNCIRGEIVSDKGMQEKDETTNFRGDHVVECYCVKNGIVVARDRIDVPITTTRD